MRRAYVYLREAIMKAILVSSKEDLFLHTLRV